MKHEDIYQFPYPLEVMIPAYLTFLEAVIGATLIAALIWDRLPGPVAIRAATLGVIVATIKGILGATLLLSFFAVEPVGIAMLGYSQFLFEFLALGAFVGLAWHQFGVSPGDWLAPCQSA
jgi:hypothetical protein